MKTLSSRIIHLCAPEQERITIEEVLVAGGSGVLGRSTVPALVEALTLKAG